MGGRTPRGLPQAGVDSKSIPCVVGVDSDAVPCAASRRVDAPRAVTVCDAVRCYAVRRDIVQLGPTPHPDTLSRAIVLAGDVPHHADQGLQQQGEGRMRGVRGVQGVRALVCSVLVLLNSRGTSKYILVASCLQHCVVLFLLQIPKRPKTHFRSMNL